MSGGGWAAKRFWQAATAVACDGGFTVTLDGRAVKTPAKTLLVVPTMAMAQAIAAEWDAQTGKIKPETMPCTRAANSALDKVSEQFEEVAGLIAAYGESDLLCYRATGPEKLVARQQAGWNPLLEWAESALGAPLNVAAGVIHIAQPPASVAALAARVHALTPFGLAAVHDLVAISGSLVLGLAVIDGRLNAQEAWDLSRIDERWNAELWGEDDEATASELVRHQGLMDAARFWGLCG